MRKIRFEVIALIAFAAGAQAAPLDVELKAHLGGVKHWDVTYRALEGGGCEIKIVTGTRKPEQAECDRLASLVVTSNDEIKKLKPVKPNAYFRTDAPLFEIKIGEKAAPVAFKAPGECKILPSGRLDCKKNRLTALNQLLLSLRNYHLRETAKGE